MHGYNAFADNGNPMDGHGHGTHCAGVVGATGLVDVVATVPAVVWVLAAVRRGRVGVDLIAVDGGARELVIRCTGEVELVTWDGVIGPHRGPMPLWGFLRRTPLTRPGRGVRALVSSLGRDFASDIERAHALSALILEKLPYRIGVTDAETTAEAALAGEGGVCQDHAHIFISAMRQLGHPARYVSGYLMMNDRTHQDATHAWAEAHFDNIGWIGFDVSNGHSPDRRYIRVATGLDYRDAAPVRGMRYGAAQENLVVQLQVQQ